ncbi:MAG: FAD-dependent oxidoreductase [Telmatospirillum sp.]|nr:FAD-dependent oxidoreductase [Telmatospirillum sp.]
MKKALIIGGGFAGCAAAHQLALMGGWDVTLVEADQRLGGGCKTLWHGGHPHTFGPRHFLTRNETVYAFLNQYLPLRSCNDHEFITYVEQDAQFYNYPIHRDDIPRMPEKDAISKELSRVTLDGIAAAKNLEEYWIASVGRTLYDKFIDGYSKKMWLVDDNRKIDDFGWSPKGVALKEGPRAAWDSAISAYPYDPEGYDPYFRIATANATVRLNTVVQSFDIPHKTVVIDGEKSTWDIIVNTISPDLLFEKCFGELPYVGRDFHAIVLPVEHAFPEGVYFVYYAGKEQFTRVVEYKKFTKHQSASTLIGLEIPSKKGKYYPLPLTSEYARADRYFDLMPEGVFSIGRAGSYRYQVDIDDSIEQALKLGELL